MVESVEEGTTRTQQRLAGKIPMIPRIRPCYLSHADPIKQIRFRLTALGVPTGLVEMHIAQLRAATAKRDLIVAQRKERGKFVRKQLMRH
jgi:hypothetical protein